MLEHIQQLLERRVLVHVNHALLEPITLQKELQLLANARNVLLEHIHQYQELWIVVHVPHALLELIHLR
jgi:hypothetical protein